MFKKISVFLVCLLLPLCAFAVSPPTISTDVLEDAMAGVYYNAILSGQGEAPVRYAMLYNNDGSTGFPSGIKVSSGGVLYGTPTTPGKYTFRLCISNEKGESYKTLTLRVKPFDESSLKRGGENKKLIGSQNDTVDGLGNPVNGGLATMQEDRLFFVNQKGLLCESTAPYTQQKRRFGQPLYAGLAVREDVLYYFQSYLDKKGETKYDHTYVNRIAMDPLGDKGRQTLTTLSKRELKVSCLYLLEDHLLFLVGEKDAVITRVPLVGGNESVMHCYHNGKELHPRMMIPYQGQVYFINEADQKLYRVWLDGEVAEELYDQPVQSLLIAMRDDEACLFLTDDENKILTLPLDGGEAEAFGDMKALTLNADRNFLYYTNPDDKSAVYRLPLDNPEAPEKICELSCDQVYVFENTLVFRAKNKKKTNFYTMNKTGEDQPVQIK